MIEADIVIGNLTTTGASNIPIMGHPPDTTSDLSFEEFITKIYAHNNNTTNSSKRKGIKLDFKSIEAFESSSTILQQYYSQVSNCYKYKL